MGYPNYLSLGSYRIYQAGNYYQSIRRKAERRNNKKFGQGNVMLWQNRCIFLIKYWNQYYRRWYCDEQRCDRDCDICHSMHINDEIPFETNDYNVKKAKRKRKECKM